ncbi:4a-hydroxytetrahydrobiopterin dehydratase [Litoreibacter sp.]|nr:4a-hydroxytetrahydrobiopterin dehydratase [Litoreibacter sp.]
MTEINTAALEATGWNKSGDGKALEKTFKFGNFTQAFGFMAQAAIQSEKLNHHPEWFNVYSRVDVRLTTHSTGGLSPLDIKLAEIMDKIAR